MKKLIIFLSIMFSSISIASTDELTVGCISGIRVCTPTSGNSCKNVWMYEGQGGIYYVSLSKSGDTPTYEIWTGKIDGTRAGIPFHLTVFQRRELNIISNFLTVQAKFGSSTVTSSGQKLAQVSILNEEDQKGITVRCESDIAPTLL